MRSIHPAPTRHARAVPIADVLRPVEIVSDHSAMLRLGSMTAQERLAAFLLDLTRRLHARGLSGYSVLLRMSRQEIGSDLGVTLETVSRTFSKLQAAGLLFVSQRQILIADAPGLRRLLEDGTAL